MHIRMWEGFGCGNRIDGCVSVLLYPLSSVSTLMVGFERCVDFQEGLVLLNYFFGLPDNGIYESCRQVTEFARRPGRAPSATTLMATALNVAGMPPIRLLTSFET